MLPIYGHLMYWQDVPGEARTRLAQLADVLDACRGVLHALTAHTHWQPGSPSLAASDVQALPCPDPRIPQAGVSSGFGLISEVVSSYLLAAGGHLGALAALYRPAEVFYAPALLVRVAVENSARAMWVLGADVEESADARLARAYLEALLSDEEQKKNTGRLGPKTSPVHQNAVARFRQRRSQVQIVFPGTTPDMMGAGQVGGQTRLRPEECVTWMFELLERHAASTISARQGEGLYGFLSNYTHPTLYPTQQMREWVDHGDHASSVHCLEIGFLDRQAQLAVVVFYNALSFVMSYFGWPTDRHDELTALIDRAMPGVFTDG